MSVIFCSISAIFCPCSRIFFVRDSTSASFAFTASTQTAYSFFADSSDSFADFSRAISTAGSSAEIFVLRSAIFAKTSEIFASPSLYSSLFLISESSNSGQFTSQSLTPVFASSSAFPSGMRSFFACSHASLYSWRFLSSASASAFFSEMVFLQMSVSAFLSSSNFAIAESILSLGSF